MANSNDWQKGLDEFLADNPATPDLQVLARSYGEEHAKDMEKVLNIEKHLDDVGLQPVPNGLQEKLKAIGAGKLQTASTKKTSNLIEFRAKHTWLSLGGVAATAVIVMLLSPSLNKQELTEPELTKLEVKQAKEDLVVAFDYLSKISNKTTAQINQTINSNLQRPVVHGVSQQLNKLRDS